MSEQKKILIVDDDPVTLKMLSVRFEINDFEVIQARDGDEAIKMAKEFVPEAIVLDLMLPKINGYEVCNMLKFDDKYKNIPIIVLSSLHEPEERDKAAKSGADAYFVKPFDLDLLVLKVRQLAGTGDAKE